MNEAAGDIVRIEIGDGVAWLTIDNPPINLLDTPLIRAIAAALGQVENDHRARVVVVQSADPDFFVAHGDVNTILSAVETGGGRSDSSPFQMMLERFRTVDKPTIGKIDGIARGGGLELFAALDMRFCSLENTRLGQPEVALGIIPGGGGTSRWPRHVGYARALEMIVSCEDIDGVTAEKWGMVNRAMPAAELDGFVDALARRIASFPPHAVSAAKRVLRSERGLADTLAMEAEAYGSAAAHPAALPPMRAFMARGGQTRQVETGADPFGGLGDGSD